MKELNRRQFLYRTAGCAAAAAMSLTGCETMPVLTTPITKTPNIIFIMADDLGYGDLGCYGQKEIKTPNIDKFAAQGMCFTDCYAGSTVSAPSRCVLMTGQHTGHTRVRNNMAKVGGTLVLDNGPAQRRVPLELQDITVAEVLKQAGYVTGITGKWGLGEPDNNGIPNRQGFDEWFGYLNQRRAHNYYPPYLWHNENKQIFESNAEGLREKYSHDMFTDFALDFIKHHSKSLFFLYLPYTVPHARYEIPSTDPYTEKPWPFEAKVHAAMITRMDTDIGRIMALLKELKIDDDTLVFFCSDNGAADRWEGIFNSSGPLRGKKADLYEGGIRTPMIVRWPGKVPAGQTSNAVWYLADVMPTFAQLADIRPPSSIDGINILPILLGKEQQTDDRFLYWEFLTHDFQQAARWKNYKAIRQALDKPLELYDLSKDIAEEHNIAAENLKIVAKFEAYLKTARTYSPNWPT
ncbi:MAG: arylsulfatase [Sedimentisphaerales bacterium]|nr:arylsulfatase [Sedimentisphaerales bacterium]